MAMNKSTFTFNHKGESSLCKKNNCGPKCSRRFSKGDQAATEPKPKKRGALVKNRKRSRIELRKTNAKTPVAYGTLCELARNQRTNRLLHEEHRDDAVGKVPRKKMEHLVSCKMARDPEYRESVLSGFATRFDE